MRRQREISTLGVPDEIAVCLVLADLAAHGWRFSATRDVIYLTRRSLADVPPREAKDQLRKSQQILESKQLADSSVREFAVQDAGRC